jgi:acyl carrier protein
MPTEQKILSDLATLLADFQDRQYGDEITAETLFFGDLGFASIDAIVLGETLEIHYAQAIPFQRFLKQLADEHVQDIAVGRLAKFLANVLR